MQTCWKLVALSKVRRGLVRRRRQRLGSGQQIRSLLLAHSREVRNRRICLRPGACCENVNWGRPKMGGGCANRAPRMRSRSRSFPSHRQYFVFEIASAEKHTCRHGWRGWRLPPSTWGAVESLSALLGPWRGVVRMEMGTSKRRALAMDWETRRWRNATGVH